MWGLGLGGEPAEDILGWLRTFFTFQSKLGSYKKFSVWLHGILWIVRLEDSTAEGYLSPLDSGRIRRSPIFWFLVLDASMHDYQMS